MIAVSGLVAVVRFPIQTRLTFYTDTATSLFSELFRRRGRSDRGGYEIYPEDL